jgi:cation:H+ antiporter
LSVLTASLLALVGLVALTVGADGLVRGASRLAVHFGVSPLAVGLTVVAYGTSAPELLASVVASLEGHAAVAVGNVLGSNVANTGLILGGTAMLAPVLVARSVLRRELPLMLATTVLFYLCGLRLGIGRATGVLFLGLLALFNLFALRWARRDAVAALEIGDGNGNANNEKRNKGPIGSSLFATLFGLSLLLGGAHLLVLGAVRVAQAIGLSDFVIGVTLVAVGTSLPELATSFVAALRKEADLVVGNIVGSNLFNILGALGLSAAIRPLPIDGRLLRFEFPALASFTLAMAVFLVTGRKVSRWEGLVLVFGYVAFVVVVVSR